MSVLIVEGRRGVGKTTFITSLAKRMDGECQIVLFKSARTAHPTIDMISTINEMASRQDELFILDRFHLTEFVLSAQLQRRPFGQLVSDTMYISSQLVNLQAIVVNMTAADETVKRRLAERSDGRQHSEFDDVRQEVAVWNMAFKAFPAFRTLHLSGGQGRLETTVDFTARVLLGHSQWVLKGK